MKMENIRPAKPLFSHTLVSFKILLLIFLYSCETPDDDQMAPNNQLSVIKFSGLCYGPHRDNENPDFGIQPTIDELRNDIPLIKNLTSSIRTYGVTDNLEEIPKLCQEFGIDCFPGAWISIFECENERQINSLIEIANQNLSHVKGLIVGNEVLLRNDVSEKQLIDFINTVKSATNGVSIATAENWLDWLEHPQLAEAVDIMLVHIHPYWDGIAIEESVNYILEKWNELQAAYPNKSMIIGETGWPSKGETRGEAIPSEQNQKKYLADFLKMADTNDINYFYFEIFDEKWKNKEGQVGSNWGLYHSDGSLKQHLTDLIPQKAQNGLQRPPRQVGSTEASFPLYVYSDGCDLNNSFHASGWMGEIVELMGDNGGSGGGLATPGSPIIVDESFTNNPYSGETCVRISYTPSVGKWGGIYWQFPLNNWGTYPGYDLLNSIGRLDDNAEVRLSFWIRGKEGGEKAEFISGGIKDTTSFEYYDSYGPIGTGIITLKKNWENHSLSLSGENLNTVIGGFAWITNYDQNPKGSTIYLDEIVFEVME